MSMLEDIEITRLSGLKYWMNQKSVDFTIHVYIWYFYAYMFLKHCGDVYYKLKVLTGEEDDY